MANELEPCPFCSKTMMLRSALWPSEGDADAIIHADPTDCPMFGFGDGSADGSIVEKWNICSSDDEDDFPSDGSCIRCGSVPRNANGLCNTCLDEDAERLENTRPAPAATDTGLETVAQAYVNEDGECEEIAWIEGLFPHPECIQLVTRSQAEELLAAEIELKQHWKDEAERFRIEFEKAAYDGLLTKARAEKAEADNAALTAKKEMLAESLHIQIKRVNELEAKLAAVEKALMIADEALQADALASAHAAIRAVLGWKPS